MAETTWPLIETVRVRLRNDYRLKENVDYSIIHKYGKTVITCCEVYRETIETVAEQHGLVIAHWCLLPNNI